MIEFRKGDILNADVEALVNTVNTEGVMGKGIALEFKEAFPKNYEIYREACYNGKVRVGEMLVYATDKITFPHYIINFPTKKEWKKPSKIEYIENGLKDLVNVIQDNKIKSIAIPPLGCGNGKLNWNEVKLLIVDAISQINGLKTVIFEPSQEAYKEKVKIKPKKDTGLTAARAWMVFMLDNYRILGYNPTLLEAQKLAYFVQRFGENLKLRYARDQFGPYARNLSYLLNYLDGIYIKGMKHKDAKPLDHLELVEEKLPEVHNFVENKFSAKQKDVLNKVQELIEGFESPLGMELLATVDFIVNEDPNIKPAMIMHELEHWSSEDSWNQRKKLILNQGFVQMAFDRLMEYKTTLYSN